MPKIKIAAVTLNTTPLDFLGNYESIVQAIGSPEAKNADCILFPELSISGYGCEDAFYKPYVWNRSEEILQKLKAVSPNQIILVGLPVFVGSFLYNCMALLWGGKVVAIIPKLNLANTGVHYERRWFHSESEFLNRTISFASEEVPFGHFIFQADQWNFGVEICEDSWSVSKPSSFYSSQGIDVLFSPGASHFAIGKQNLRRQIFTESSRNQCNLQVFTNLTGNESGRIIFEGGAIFTSLGNLVKEGPRLSFSPFQITSYTFDPLEIRAAKARSFRESKPKISREEIPKIQLKTIYHLEEKQSNRFSLLDRRKELGQEDTENSGNLSSYEEFTKAVCLGLFDYLKKSKTKGFTLSLSGGADSATCALLVSAMKEIAKRENGDSIFTILGIEETNLLVTIYQKTVNNSDLTETIAESLAKELGCLFYTISIDEAVETSIKLIESVIGKTLNWKEHDLPLQNIQARVRSPLVWLLANLNGHLLLSTGNRSEAAVGYTTMDGDSSGSIAPLAGVSKEFLLEFLDDIQKGNNRFISPKDSIQTLRNTKPTAELKPLSESQEDEKDLMPYPILQSIEKKLVFLALDDLDCLERLKQEFPWENTDILLGYLKKFKKLFAISQWKRERLPPSFHLDDYGLDPKSSYRFPILSKEN
ncbi:NAD(+) synthase [Leptospira sp. 2 VSF19]|uniref:Glutamine-dependent NAD(+) synthetase n=1 Tax=Leptospira soteropolitanensis TaxID=2950025 RepID=A0AAW5VEV0_9LEPT|nr:NAD(+) synthase [Leptospira soteropolitanensis]MCW7492927.1 NAD(+) synthase [Leptospira soteropolitanensis]MCW7500162.1 NAD(+) synthase [Leptospira soteropolitanensis]MCW7522413.1 NAD(+) synthase [Leptospira soteropolitanensis]MCW7526269.1 NAD(+) synthase [Leptospira soteropolitanensis]MCW7529619.1 NAD(+) synthase [Leptospira soteropolitanensis]